MIKMVKKITIFGIFSLVLSIFILSAGKEALSYSKKREYKIRTENGIEELLTLEIGGIKQSILIRGQNKKKPVLLYLDGGPGALMYQKVRADEVFSELEKSFVVIYWQQRGSVKSYSKTLNHNNMKMENFVSDTNEITEYLKQKFDKDKISLMGHCWGSDIGLLTIAKHPNNYFAYYGIAQDVKPNVSDIDVYKKLYEIIKQDGNTEAIKSLEKIGEPPYPSDESLMIRLYWAKKYRGRFINRGNESLFSFENIIDIISTPEYSLLDIFNLIKNPSRGYELVRASEYMELDFFETIKEVEVPVYFFAGKHDLIVSDELSKSYFDKLKTNSKKEYYTFDNSAHYLHYTETDKFIDIVTQTLENNHD